MADNNNLPEGTDIVIDDGTAGETYGDDQGQAAERSGAAGGGSTSSGSDGNSASGAGTSAGASSGSPQGVFAAFKEAALNQTADLRVQAGERARDFAGQGKDRVTEALSNAAELFHDAAGQVEEKIGPEYGAYARRAADAVNNAAESLRTKDVDALVEDAKSLVRSSPAVAIGAAAAIGFVLARLARSGVPAGDTPSDTTDQNHGS